MESHYRKDHYNDLPGFRLRHTEGPNAANSTTDHLHLNANRMLLYCIRGGGNIVVEDKAYRIQAGDVIITDAAELFHCSIDPHTYHERISIHIEPQFWDKFPYDTSSLFHSFTSREKGQSNLIPAEIVESSGLAAVFADLFDLMQQDSPHRNMLALAKLIQLLSLLDEIPKTADTLTEALPKDPLVSQVLQYLNTHCTQIIDVDTVAAHFNITSSYLSHLFKKRTGFSLWNYVILRRLQRANDLICQGYSAEAACYRVGFDNYANFFRLYKKHTGITPSQFKKQVR